MTSEEILDRIEIKLNDPAILRANLLKKLNERYYGILADVPVPDLIITQEAVAVAADDRSVLLPTDFHHDLLNVYSDTNSIDIPIDLHRRALYRGYQEGDTGEVERCCREGISLLLRPISSGVNSLLVDYYAKPIALVDDSTAVTYIPDFLHEPILVNSVFLVYVPESDRLDPLKKAAIKDAEENLYIGIRRLRKFYPNQPRTRPEKYRPVQTF